VSALIEAAFGTFLILGVAAFLALPVAVAQWARTRRERVARPHKPPEAAAVSPVPSGGVPPAATPPPGPRSHGGPVRLTAERPCGCTWAHTRAGWMTLAACDEELYRQLREMSR
jgi:hypothetical protein